MGIGVAGPVAIKYKKLSITPSIDYNKDVTAYMATRVLNLLVTVISGDEFIDALWDHTSYEVDELGSTVIQDFIEEISICRTAINSIPLSFTSRVEGDTRYDHDLSKRRKVVNVLLEVNH